MQQLQLMKEGDKSSDRDDEEIKRKKSSLFWKTFWIVFAIAMARVVYVLFWLTPTLDDSVTEPVVPQSRLNQFSESEL